MINTRAYATLKPLAQSMKKQHLKKLFEQDTQRFELFHQQMKGLLFDFSKQKIDANILNGLLALAEELELTEWIEKLFNGEKINHTESRAAWHTALRDIQSPPPEVAQQW
ncbi:Glucose-6-phosphate isomerase, partial [hydrothermal vent metagenome]